MVEVDEVVWEPGVWEPERLRTQAPLLESLTERFLLEAGLRPGMRVLDVGSGQGDVALIAARIVGPTGRVVAWERSEAALWTIRARARERGLTQIDVVPGDFLRERLPGAGAGTFDALVGRLVLMHVPEVPATLWHLASHLRPGGLLALQEFDFGGARTIPTSPTFERALSWVTRTLAKRGAHPRLGLELRRHFLDAGLPEPSLRVDESLGGASDYLGYAFWAEVLQGLLPTMKALGVARPEDVDVDTLAQRLHAEVGAHGGVLLLPSLMGAWTTLP